MIKLQLDSKNKEIFYLRIPFQDVQSRNKAKQLGGLWDMQKKAWKFVFDIRVWNSIQKALIEKIQLPSVFKFLLNKKAKQQKLFMSYKQIAQKDEPIQYQIEGLRLKGKNPLFNYQKHGIKCVLQAGDGFLLGDQPGLGKSLQGLGIALQKKNKGQINNCLIVCPASLKYNWLDEIQKFTQQSVIVIDGKKQQRQNKWIAKGFFFKIVGYQTIVCDLYKDPKNEVDKRIECADAVLNSFDCIVVDQIHSIKHNTSLRSKALKKFKAKYRIGLTGTPIDGKLEQIQALFQFLKPGLFPSKSKFLQRYAKKDFWGRVISYRNIGQVKQKISPYYLRRLKKVVFKDLPKLLYKNIYIQLPDKQMKLYNKLVKGKTEVTKQSEAMQLMTKARLFCDFPELLDMRNPSAKFAALSELLQQLIKQNGQKVIIFTQYRKVMDLLYKNLKDDYNILMIHGDVDTKQRVELCKRFNEDPNVNIIMGTDAMSTGLNLQQADAQINFQDNFSPAIMIQRYNRCNRATSTKSSVIYRFITKDTVEQRVRQTIQKKMMLNDVILDETSDELANISFSCLQLINCL